VCLGSWMVGWSVNLFELQPLSVYNPELPEPNLIFRRFRKIAKSDY
jgi:hypothetical protein